MTELGSVSSLMFGEVLGLNDTILTTDLIPTATTQLTVGATAGISQFGPLVTTLVSAVIAVCTFCTLTGNLLVCLAVFQVRKLREEPANYLLVSLAVSDFFVGLIVMPLAYIHLYHGHWDLGDALCYVWTSSDVTLCTASILNLCAISVDRYMAITHPFSYGTFKRTVKRMVLYIGFVWVLALLVSVVPLVAVRSPRVKGVCQVSQNIYYQIYATLGSFYVPTAIMLCVNVKILLAVKRLTRSDRETTVGVNHHADPHNGTVESSLEAVTIPNSCSMADHCEGVHDGVLPPRRANNSGSKHNSASIPLLRRFTQVLDIGTHMFRGGSLDSNHSHDHQHVLSGESKALKTLSVIMGAFIGCWLPFFVMALMKAYCGKSKCGIPWWLDTLALWLGYINSMLNPMVYCKYNRDFRVPFREMICCRFKTLQTVLRTEMFAEQFGDPGELHHQNSNNRGNSATIMTNYCAEVTVNRSPTVIANNTSF